MQYDKRDKLVDAFQEVFAAHRGRIDAMTDTEYREYKRRRAEAHANQDA